MAGWSSQGVRMEAGPVLSVHKRTLGPSLSSPCPPHPCPVPCGQLRSELPEAGSGCSLPGGEDVPVTDGDNVRQTHLIHRLSRGREWPGRGGRRDYRSEYFLEILYLYFNNFLVEENGTIKRFIWFCWSACTLPTGMVVGVPTWMVRQRMTGDEGPGRQPPGPGARDCPSSRARGVGGIGVTFAGEAFRSGGDTMTDRPPAR